MQLGAHVDTSSSARCAADPAPRPSWLIRSAVFSTDAPSMTMIRIQNSQVGQCWRSMTRQVCSAARSRGGGGSGTCPAAIATTTAKAGPAAGCRRWMPRSLPGQRLPHAARARPDTAARPPAARLRESPPRRSPDSYRLACHRARPGRASASLPESPPRGSRGDNYHPAWAALTLARRHGCSEHGIVGWRCPACRFALVAACPGTTGGRVV